MNASTVEHDGPILRAVPGTGARPLLNCFCSCGKWSVRRYSGCRLNLVRAFHSHVLAARKLEVTTLPEDGELAR